MQKLGAKFCQVTRRTPLNALTRMLQSCWYIVIGKKKISHKSDSPCTLWENQSCLLCGKAGGVSSFRFVSGKTDFLYHLLPSKSPEGLSFWGSLESVAVLTFWLGAAVCFCPNIVVAPWLSFGWVCIVVDQEQKRKREFADPLLLHSYRLTQTQSATPWKGRPAHPGVTFAYISKRPTQIH